MSQRQTAWSVLATVMLTVGAPTVFAGDLLWRAETVDGRVIRSRQPDRQFNPASVVKIATSLWALETLGADHRYETVVGRTGLVTSGVLKGDLVFDGGGDPDLQWENIYLIARELERLGVRRVEGDLVVTGAFWLGWEHGTEGRQADPEARAQQMADRLFETLDPTRWTKSHRASWEALCSRRGWDASKPPGVEVSGRPVAHTPAGVTPLFRHLSNPLPVVLRRFNVFSNNDIVRLCELRGGALIVEEFVRQSLPGAGGVRLETASGEGTNRMTARQVVALLRMARSRLEDVGLGPADVLPVVGCDPGPTRSMFRRLTTGTFTRTLVCKTGTLRRTDGGVAVLSGFLKTPQGDVLLCVAAPNAGNDLRRSRKREEKWVLELIDELGGARAVTCGVPLPFSDHDARVERLKVESAVFCSPFPSRNSGRVRRGV